MFLLFVRLINLFNKKVCTHQIGAETLTYRGVPIHENGTDTDHSHGKHFSPDEAYYYGQKWQCVEYVKRFYDQALNHRMPHVWGHAKDYFDNTLAPGQLNTKRNLIQFKNRGGIAPEVDDIVVFSDTRFGHLAIITAVLPNAVEVVQQNIAGKPRQTFRLKRHNGLFHIDRPRLPDGWLRLVTYIR